MLSCKESKNHNIANLYRSGKKCEIMLTGRRVPLVHDPYSIVKDKLVEDTLLLVIKQFKNGLISGDEIEVPKGNYKYKGYIEIRGDKLYVQLLIDNTDDKKLVPEIWNGEYKVNFKD